MCCVAAVARRWRCVNAVRVEGVRIDGVASMARRWRQRASGKSRIDGMRVGVGRALCVRRATAARGAPSWLGRDAETHTFCFMSDGTLAPATRAQ